MLIKLCWKASFARKMPLSLGRPRGVALDLRELRGEQHEQLHELRLQPVLPVPQPGVVVPPDCGKIKYLPTEFKYK